MAKRFRLKRKETQMRLLILTQYFPPEIGAPQVRLLSMASELKRLGHEVEVVTALPNYPRGRFFRGYEWCFYRCDTLGDVIVHRVWLHPALGGGVQRMLNYGTFAITSLFGLSRAKKPDGIFIESPSLLLTIPGWIAASLWRVPIILNVADLWPDSIVEMGFMKDGLLIRLLTALESWSYRKAAYINVMTEGQREVLLRKKGVPARKVLFLPNGVDTIQFSPRPIDAALKQQLGLEGKKIFLWTGTQGHAHGLEHVLQAAKLLKNKPEIHFLFVGDGSERLNLERLRNNMGLQNVTFRDPVPPEELPPYFSISESGLASLRGIPIFDGARPSKIFPILASGKPLIFIGRGEGARLVEKARAGVVVPPGDPTALAEAVLQLAGNPELARELGVNGRLFVEENHQWSKLVSAWMTQLSQLYAQEAIPAREA
jgi:glycosyltransferase involved in cell wall biosynthesis